MKAKKVYIIYKGDKIIHEGGNKAKAVKIAKQAAVSLRYTYEFTETVS